MKKNKEYLELSKMSEQELREELLSLRREIASLTPYKPSAAETKALEKRTRAYLVSLGVDPNSLVK